MSDLDDFEEPTGGIGTIQQPTWTFTNKTNNTQVKFETNKGVVKYANGGEEVTFTIDDTGINNPYLKITMVDGNGYKMIITCEDNEYVLPNGTKEEIEDAATGIILNDFPAEDGHFEITLEKAVQDAKERGMYINDKLVSAIQMDGKSVTKITDENGKVLWEYFNDYFYVQNENALMNTLTLTKTGTPAATDLQYKLDNGNLKGTWKDVTFSDDNKFQIMMAIRGSRVSFRSTTGFSSSSSDYFTIKCTNQFSVGGNILSLVNYKNTKYIDTLPDYCFKSMFDNASAITKMNIDLGSVTTVGNGSFRLFCYHVGLTDVSFKNVIKTVGDDGFRNCFTNTHITTPPDFSNVETVGNYGFYECFAQSKLTTSPDFRNITSVGNYGFQCCFQRCSSLNEAYAPSVSPWSYANFSSWLYGVAATGTLHRSSVNLVIPENSNSGCPSGWTLEPSEEKQLVDIYIEDSQDEDSTVTVNGVTKTATSEKTLAFENVDTSVMNTIYINRPYKGFTTLFLNGNILREMDSEREITYSIPANTEGEILVSFDR